MILPSFQTGQLTTPAANTSFINKYKFFKDACVSLSFWYSQVLSFDWSWFQWSSAGVDAHYAIIRRNCLSLPFYYTEKYSVCKKKKACHCFVQCIHTIKPGQCTIFCSLSTMIWATSWEKPVYAICEQQRRRSACALAQSDQRLCCSLPR